MITTLHPDDTGDGDVTERCNVGACAPTSPSSQPMVRRSPPISTSLTTCPKTFPIGRRSALVGGTDRGAAVPQGRRHRFVPHRPTSATLSAGFAVLRLDLRGTGSSTGITTDEYAGGRTHRSARPRSRGSPPSRGRPGRVGMFGTSYSGFNSLQMAAERVGSASRARRGRRHLRHRRPLHRRRPLRRRRAAGARPDRLPALHGRDERAAARAVGVRGWLAGRVAPPARRDAAVADGVAGEPARRSDVATGLGPARTRR